MPGLASGPALAWITATYGIEGNGKEIRIELKCIWANNIYGFDPEWQAGGVKIAESAGVTFRSNHVHDNIGPGLWCDIERRNVVYEENLGENNKDIGIFHEISFKAVIRSNVVRHNGRTGAGFGVPISCCCVAGCGGDRQHGDGRTLGVRNHVDRSRAPARHRRTVQDAQRPRTR